MLWRSALLVESLPAHRARSGPRRCARSAHRPGTPPIDHQRAVQRGLVIVAIEQHQISPSVTSADSATLLEVRGAVEHEIGLFRTKNSARPLSAPAAPDLHGFSRSPRSSTELSRSSRKHGLAQMLHEDPARSGCGCKTRRHCAPGRSRADCPPRHSRPSAPKNGVFSVSAYCFRRLTRFLAMKDGVSLRQEDITVDEVEHLHRQVLEPLAADQQHDREVQAAAAHQIDQRPRFLAFEALLAPIDHHATDRGVGLNCDLGNPPACGP